MTERLVGDRGLEILVPACSFVKMSDPLKSGRSSCLFCSRSNFSISSDRFLFRFHQMYAKSTAMISTTPKKTGRAIAMPFVEDDADAAASSVAEALAAAGALVLSADESDEGVPDTELTEPAEPDEGAPASVGRDDSEAAAVDGSTDGEDSEGASEGDSAACEDSEGASVGDTADCEDSEGATVGDIADCEDSVSVFPLALDTSPFVWNKEAAGAVEGFAVMGNSSFAPFGGLARLGSMGDLKTSSEDGTVVMMAGAAASMIEAEFDNVDELRMMRRLLGLGGAVVMTWSRPLMVSVSSLPLPEEQCGVVRYASSFISRTRRVAPWAEK
jgi:hypothetical protein